MYILLFNKINFVSKVWLLCTKCMHYCTVSWDPYIQIAASFDFNDLKKGCTDFFSKLHQITSSKLNGLSCHRWLQLVWFFHENAKFCRIKKPNGFLNVPWKLCFTWKLLLKCQNTKNWICRKISLKSRLRWQQCTVVVKSLLYNLLVQLRFSHGLWTHDD